MSEFPRNITSKMPAMILRADPRLAARYAQQDRNEAAAERDAQALYESLGSFAAARFVEAWAEAEPGVAALIWAGETVGEMGGIIEAFNRHASRACEPRDHDHDLAVAFRLAALTTGAVGMRPITCAPWDDHIDPLIRRVRPPEITDRAIEEARANGLLDEIEIDAEIAGE